MFVGEKVFRFVGGGKVFEVFIVVFELCIFFVYCCYEIEG